MEEKIIIESSAYNAKKFSKIVLWLGIIVAAMLFIVPCVLGDHPLGQGIINISAVAVVVLIYYFVVWALGCGSITITDKRAYGKTGFGKQVDLPIDSISSVGMCAFKGISIGTSSGKIIFHFLSNQEKIHSELSKLLIERQHKEQKSTIVENIVPQSSAEELKKYKELLDSGVITQEEFDEKKKQLLGL